MAKLHELLAVEGDLEGAFKKILAETTTTFTKRADHFQAFHRVCNMFDDNALAQPEEHKAMDTTVQLKLHHQKGHVVRYLDAVLQKERTNQEARADIVIDGVVITKDVPATFLLGLESKLKQVRAVYDSAPTLAPGTKWDPDPQNGEGVYVAAHPEESFKTENGYKVQVLYDATKEHPAQVEKLKEVKNIGRYVKQIWSGMISPAEKSAMLGRIDKLIRAVKKARQRANTTKVVKMTVGDELFNYIAS